MKIYEVIGCNLFESPDRRFPGKRLKVADHMHLVEVIQPTSDIAPRCGVDGFHSQGPLETAIRKSIFGLNPM
jgi:hypothetical protein